jgi:hypothetical protein
MRFDPKFCEKTGCEHLRNVEELGGKKLATLFCGIMCDDLPILDECQAREPCQNCPAMTTMSENCPFKLEALMEQQNASE